MTVLKSNLSNSKSTNIDHLKSVTPIHLCKLLQLCPTLCDPIICSPPGSFVHWERILERSIQGRILERIAISSSADLLNAGGFFINWAMREYTYFLFNIYHICENLKRLHLTTIILKIQLWGNSYKCLSDLFYRSALIFCKTALNQKTSQKCMLNKFKLTWN